jgi:hypothetical protein
MGLEALQHRDSLLAADTGVQTLLINSKHSWCQLLTTLCLSYDSPGRDVHCHLHFKGVT